MHFFRHAPLFSLLIAALWAPLSLAGQTSATCAESFKTLEKAHPEPLELEGFSSPGALAQAVRKLSNKSQLKKFLGNHEEDVLKVIAAGVEGRDPVTALDLLLRVRVLDANEFESLLRQVPDGEDLLFKIIPANEIPPKIQAEWRKMAELQLARLEELPAEDYLYYAAETQPFRNPFQLLPADKRYALATKKTDEYLPTAAYQITSVPVQTLRDMVVQRYFALLGFGSRLITTVGTFQDYTGRTILEILSTRPIRDPWATNQLPYNGGAIFSQADSAVIIRSKDQGIKKGTLEWETGKKKFKADLTFFPNPRAEKLAPAAKSFDYPSAWKDNRLTGMYVISSNEKKEDAIYTWNEIRSYLKRSGFRLEPQKSVVDTADWMKTLVEGKVDYWIKGGHSGGGGVVEVGKNGVMFRAERKLPDGKIEDFYVYRANYVGKTEENQPIHLPIETYSEWLARRKSNKGGPLLHIDASCYSSGVACRTIARAGQSENLVFIPSTTMVTGFEDFPDAPLPILLDAIRAKKSYAQMRKDLEKNSDYVAGNLEQFVFPDGVDYEKSVRSKIRSSHHLSDIKLYEDGKPITYDEMTTR